MIITGTQSNVQMILGGARIITLFGQVTFGWKANETHKGITPKSDKVFRDFRLDNAALVVHNMRPWYWAFSYAEGHLDDWVIFLII